MNYYPFHIGDYLSATRHLSWEEDAAFRRLLDTYYTTEKPLPADHRAVCRLVLATTDSQREAVQVVLEEFFESTPEGWINRRADAEIARMSDKREKARESALAGVKARQSKAESNAQLRAERLAAARAKGSHTSEQWGRMLDLCGNACVRCGATGVPLQKDHILPLYQGGSDGIENLQPLCRSCNCSKGPEAIDHRSEHVRSAFADEIRANAEKKVADGELPTPTPTPRKEQKQKGPPQAAALVFDPPDWIDRAAWDGYVEMRRRIRKPPTPRACELVVMALDGHRRRGHDPTAMLDQSTRNSWTDIYPPKPGNDHAARSGHRESLSERAERKAREGDERERLAGHR